MKDQTILNDAEMSDLEKYFFSKKGREMVKFVQHIHRYDRYLSRFRNKEVLLVELGVGQGGSLQMWKEYLGEKATIVGIDKNDYKEVEEERISVIIGDETNDDFLKSITTKFPKIDILIDDGSHEPVDQIHAFEFLYPCLADDGLYACEDLYHSYTEKHGGGFRRKGSTIEFFKDLIDNIHCNIGENQISYKDNAYSSISGISFYQNIAFIENAKGELRHAMRRGNILLSTTPPYRIKANGERETI